MDVLSALKLSGYKTYIVVALIIAGGVASAFGVQIPEVVWVILAGAGLASVRAGVKKAEKTITAAKAEVEAWRRYVEVIEGGGGAGEDAENNGAADSGGGG